MFRLAPIAHAVAIVGGLMAVVGWAVGGFPTPDGTGRSLLMIGIALGLLAEAGVWIAQRPRSGD